MLTTIYDSVKSYQYGLLRKIFGIVNK